MKNMYMVHANGIELTTRFILYIDSVFFSSTCGRKLDHSPSLTVLNPDDDNDRRLASLSAAVDFARTNNLLGIWVDANLLVRASL